MARSKWRKALLIGLVVATSVVVMGCSRERSYTSPNFPFMNRYTSHKAAVPVLLDNVSWWRGFNDPVLNQLVDRALVGNLDLVLARERVIEARANENGTPENLSLSPAARISREKDFSGTLNTRDEASLGLSWMLDPYGARRAQIKAAHARVEATDAEVDAARLLILYNVANAYVDLRYRQRLLQVRLSEIQSRTQTLDLTRTLVGQKTATRLDQIWAEARLAEAQAQIPSLRAAIQSSKYQIAMLLGMPPGAIDIDLDSHARQPQPGMSAQVGIPADLLRNRPDIRIAERLYYASVAEVGVADAALYPSLSLVGEITLASIHGGAAGSEYVFGPTVRLPALPGGSRRAAVAARVVASPAGPHLVEIDRARRGCRGRKRAGGILRRHHRGPRIAEDRAPLPRGGDPDAGPRDPRRRHGSRPAGCRGIDRQRRCNAGGFPSPDGAQLCPTEREPGLWKRGFGRIWAEPCRRRARLSGASRSFMSALSCMLPISGSDAIEAFEATIAS